MPVTSRLDVTDRRGRILALRRRGVVRYADLAKRLGVSIRTVKRDAAAIDQILKNELRATIRETYIARHLDEIGGLKRENYEAWARSKQPEEVAVAKVKKKRTSGVDANGRPVVAEETSTEQRRRGQVGDPAFLHVAIDLLQREAELLGLDALPDTQRKTASVEAARGVMDIVRLLESDARAEIVDVPVEDADYVDATQTPPLPPPSTSNLADEDDEAPKPSADASLFNHFLRTSV